MTTKERIVKSFLILQENDKKFWSDFHNNKPTPGSRCDIYAPSTNYEPFGKRRLEELAERVKTMDIIAKLVGGFDDDVADVVSEFVGRYGFPLPIVRILDKYEEPPPQTGSMVFVKTKVKRCDNERVTIIMEHCLRPLAKKVFGTAAEGPIAVSGVDCYLHFETIERKMETFHPIGDYNYHPYHYWKMEDGHHPMEVVGFPKSSPFEDFELFSVLSKNGHGLFYNEDDYNIYLDMIGRKDKRIEDIHTKMRK